MTAFTRILCPVDLSDVSLRAVEYASALARAYDADLLILHVMPPFDGAGEPSPGTPDLLERAAADVTEAVTPLVAGTRFTIAVDQGGVSAGILHRARHWPAALIVMGTHGHGGLHRLLLGSVTEKVLHDAPCMVLTVSPDAMPAPSGTASFARILCPVDFSPPSLAAWDVARDLARPGQSTVTVLHAVEYMDDREMCEHVAADIRHLRRRVVDDARSRLHMLVTEHPSAGDVHELVVVSRAYRAILKEALARAADVIVMGAQGTSGVELFLYGSNTQHVVRAARCPVLTVRG